MPPWRLRRATSADAAAVALVANATFLETYADTQRGVDIVAHCTVKNAPQAYAAWAGDPASILTLAENDNSAPIGYTLVTAPDLPVDTGADDLELRRIYVLAQLHGAGLGHALMSRAVEDAAAAGAKRLLLGMFARNLSARAFYERQGFHVIGTRQFQVGETLNDDLIYARAI